MRRMSRHTEADDLVLCTVLVELRRSMATMAVEDKQAVGSLCTRCRMSIKVLNPLKTELISSLTIVAYSDYSVWG